MILLTEDQRRECVIACARDCERSLWLADNAGRFGTVRERLSEIAGHQRDARVFAALAFTWATAEVAA